MSHFFRFQSENILAQILHIFNLIPTIKNNSWRPKWPSCAWKFTIKRSNSSNLEQTFVQISWFWPIYREFSKYRMAILIFKGYFEFLPPNLKFERFLSKYRKFSGRNRKKWLIKTLTRTFFIICWNYKFEDISNKRHVRWSPF